MNKEMPIEGFEKWTQTGRGRRCLDTNGLTPEFLKNRLWWAYHAGIQSKDVKLVSPVEDVLNEIAALTSSYIPKRIRDKAKYILQNRQDYIRL